MEWNLAPSSAAVPPGPVEAARLGIRPVAVYFRHDSGRDLCALQAGGSRVGSGMGTETQTDQNWRAIFNDELAAWKAKSYADLRGALSGVCCVHYDREESGGRYQVEVQLLENRSDYVHVMFEVYEPRGWRALSTSFIRYADGRLDA